MSRIGPSVGEAFHVAAAELGMCSASWLFVGEIAAELGESAIGELRDVLGRSFPILDAVAEAWTRGERAPRIDTSQVLAACAGSAELVIVGLEALFLDELIPRLERKTAVTLLANLGADANWERVIANYAGRVETADLSSFQRKAGRRSALLTFLYGARGESSWADPSWQRVIGPDVRTQFRTIIGWDVLGDVMYLYPRFMVESPIRDFSHVIRPR